MLQWDVFSLIKDREILSHATIQMNHEAEWWFPGAGETGRWGVAI